MNSIQAKMEEMLFDALICNGALRCKQTGTSQLPVPVAPEIKWSCL